MRSQKINKTKFQINLLLFIFIQAGLCFSSNLVFHDSTSTADSIKVFFDDSYDFSDVDVKPMVLEKAVPKYPDVAKEKLIEGTVVVSIIIDENGDVIEATIKKSVPLLDEACLDAAKSLKFKPGKLKGKLVKVKMAIPFKFNL